MRRIDHSTKPVKLASLFQGEGWIQTKAEQFERDLSATLAYYCKNRLNDERGLRVNTTLIHCGIHLFQKRLLQ